MGNASDYRPSMDTGTVMLFRQSTAPTGWVKRTTNNGAALRFVTGTAAAGGTVALDQLSAVTTAETTLTEAEMPSHNHYLSNVPGGGGYTYGGSTSMVTSFNTNNTGSQGGSSAHVHAGVNINPKYTDVIHAEKS